MVKEFHTNHHFLECDNQNLLENLYRAVDARDLPCMADVESSMLYFCSQVVKQNKVALTGECADEIFGGYPWFHTKEAFQMSAFPWSPDMKVRQTLLSKEVIHSLPMECADEIFGGYPWFHTKEAFQMSAFPWSPDMKVRQTLLSKEVIHSLPMEAYARAAYEKTIEETPVLEGESQEEKRRREIAYLNLKWFMVTLLDRMDRTSMYSGLEARVPLADYRIESQEEKRRREIAYLNLKWFMVTLLDRMDRTSMYSGLEARVPLADYRIIEYVWNVPWEMKCRPGYLWQITGLLNMYGMFHGK